MARDVITLAELEGRVDLLEVRCSRCDRRGRLRLARLIAEHRPDAALPAAAAHARRRLRAAGGVGV